jgi:hypothetical protein
MSSIAQRVGWLRSAVRWWEDVESVVARAERRLQPR